ncbi:hypothetical protein NG798_13805 [Ancylothrix sp. C2]|nr:hypothetical protein [Ancylothrix sp. D3o]
MFNTKIVNVVLIGVRGSLAETQLPSRQSPPVILGTLRPVALGPGLSMLKVRG